MRPIHIIMPMAGEGSRFINEGWATPKPLIPLRGKLLFQRAIESISIVGAPMKYSFIVRQEHIDKYAIDKKIKELLPNANIFSVLKTTRGAVETCLIARDAIDKNDKAYIAEITEILSKPIENVNGGMLVSFDANEPRYSFAEIDKNNVVIRTAEKEVISNHALCGAYFFSKAESFLYAADLLLNESNFNKPEFYVSLLYNYLLKRGEIIKLAKMEEYYSYGTPEELKKYL